MTAEENIAQNEPGVWRDEETLPLSELTKAFATASTDGQADDPAGNDAGIEAEEPGHRPDDDAHPAGDPDPSSAAGRALRTDFTGPTGPN